MPRTRRPAKVDSNQPAIVEALRRAGASVRSTAMVGDGFPDLAVGILGATFLVEIKGERGKLSPAEEKFFDAWTGHVVIIRTPEQAIDFVNCKRMGMKV